MLWSAEAPPEDAARSALKAPWYACGPQPGGDRVIGSAGGSRQCEGECDKPGGIDAVHEVRIPTGADRATWVNRPSVPLANMEYGI